ncbi:MAG: transcription elongation factor GreA [Candidatus Magasanikbacteria bacterium]
MSDESIQFLSKEKYEELKKEIEELKHEKIPGIAKRIDDARQMGDLSENAEYHQAREDMSWAQGRLKEVQFILDNAEIIQEDLSGSGKITLGSQITVEVAGKEKEFFIVGAQEADPLIGKISNESPLGNAFLGKMKGESVDVKIPSGSRRYKILKVG